MQPFCFLFPPPEEMGSLDRKRALCFKALLVAGRLRGVLRQRAARRTAGAFATRTRATEQRVEQRPCDWPCSNPTFPQNLGAFIRLSACLKVPLDVIEPCGFPVDDKRIRRAAMDYYDLAQHRPTRLVGRVQARPAGGPAGPADDQGRDGFPGRRLRQATTSCCSAARAPACPTMSTRRPTSGCVSRCRRAPARSMSRWRPPW